MRSVNHANRGMGLEWTLNYANLQYTAKGIANIRKVSTPWKVVRSGNRIVSAYPEGDSTVDYMGDLQGRSICFEAKSTKETTSMPLSNFHEHQIEFLRKWSGIKFIIVELAAYNETYFMPVPFLLEYWDGLKGRKSIPIDEIRTLGRIEQGSGIILHYLEHVEVKDP